MRNPLRKALWSFAFSCWELGWFSLPSLALSINRRLLQTL